MERKDRAGQQTETEQADPSIISLGRSHGVQLMPHTTWGVLSLDCQQQGVMCFSVHLRGTGMFVVATCCGGEEKHPAVQHQNRDQPDNFGGPRSTTVRLLLNVLL